MLNLQIHLVSLRRARSDINPLQFPAHDTSGRNRNAGGDPCPSTSINRAATHSEAETSSTQSCRPLSLGVAVSIVVGLANRSHHRETRNRYRLAPSRLPTVLDLENPSRKNRTSARFERNSGSDSQDESREPVVGSPSDSRRTTEIGHLDF